MEEQTDSARELILNFLKGKAVLKQNVYANTNKVFFDLKAVIRLLVDDLKKEILKADNRIIIEYHDKGDFEIELKIADDTIIFIMHTDIFEFEKDHNIKKSSYTEAEPGRSFCGMISVYNFLTDSLVYDRENDVGYLVARLFINKDMHYFVEGKKQLGFLYNDFEHSTIDKEQIKNIVESVLLYSLDFDLFVPPFDSMKELTVQEIIAKASIHSAITTGKRLGFQF